MGSTLSHGYYKPAQGDTGDVWFPGWQANAQLMNDHTHNGTDGALLGIQTLSILAANWGSPTNGTYVQTITLPLINGVQVSYDAIEYQFRLSTGQVIYPSITRLSTTQFTIATIDNTQTYTMLYR